MVILTINQYIPFFSIISGGSVTRNVGGTNTRKPKKQPACLSTKTVEEQMDKYLSKMTIVTSMKKVCYSEIS